MSLKHASDTATFGDSTGSTLNEYSDDNILPAPPPAPRAVTRNARRRSWAEPRVRSWWLMALLLSFIALWFAGVRVYGSSKDYWLIKHGIRVEADVLDVDGNPLKKLY